MLKEVLILLGAFFYCDKKNKLLIISRNIFKIIVFKIVPISWAIICAQYVCILTCAMYNKSSQIFHFFVLWWKRTLIFVQVKDTKFYLKMAN